MKYLSMTRVMLLDDYINAGKKNKAGSVFTVCCYDYNTHEYGLVLLGEKHTMIHDAYIPEKYLVEV